MIPRAALRPALALGVVLASALAGTASAEPPPRRTIRVAAVQMRSTCDLDENLETIERHLARCAGQGVQIAVFPECALTGYFEDAVKRLSAEQLDAAEQRLTALCRSNRIAAVVGSAWRSDGKLLNSALIVDACGHVVERYDKVQLAEPWPEGGNHLSVFSLRGVPCSVIICHDERYPELVRLPVLAGARLVFYISHESGVRQENKIGPYRAQIQARAVENSVYVVQANAPANPDLTGSHGQSRIIAPDGNLIAEATMFDDDLLIADLALDRATAANAQRSLTRGPLIDWWKAGLKQVQRISPHVCPESNAR